MQIEWKKISEHSQKVAFRTIIHKKFELPDGSQHDYTVMDYRPGAALVIAMTQDNKFIVARQFRAGSEVVMDELPGGFIDQSEEPIVAAARELREETGYAADDLEFLGKLARDAYIAGDYYYYLARNCHKLDVTPRHGEREFINVVEITVDEMLDNIVSGRITDSAGALLALRKLGL